MDFSNHPIRQQLSTAAAVVNEVNPAVTAVSNKQIDALIEDYGDLTRSGKPMDGYYADTIRRLGVERWLQLAHVARVEGKNKPRYFNWLLKHELSLSKTT